jgi:prevent-host-death family protein
VDKTYNVHEAKTHLSELLERAQAGEEIVIAKANKPMVRLVPFRAPRKKKRVFGLGKKSILWVAPDFDAALPDEFWYGGPNDLVTQTLKRMAARQKRPQLTTRRRSGAAAARRRAR